MNNKILNFLVCGIIAINSLCCKNNTEKQSVKNTNPETKLKVDKTKEIQPESDYSITNKIEVIIENDADYLIGRNPTEIFLKKENIYKSLLKISIEENKSLDLLGPKIDTSGIRIILIATEKNLSKGKIVIQITERDEIGESFIHKLIIPVKENVE